MLLNRPLSAKRRQCRRILNGANVCMSNFGRTFIFLDATVNIHPIGWKSDRIELRASKHLRNNSIKISIIFIQFGAVPVLFTADTAVPLFNGTEPTRHVPEANEQREAPLYDVMCGVPQRYYLIIDLPVLATTFLDVSAICTLCRACLRTIIIRCRSSARREPKAKLFASALKVPCRATPPRTSIIGFTLHFDQNTGSRQMTSVGYVPTRGSWSVSCCRCDHRSQRKTCARIDSPIDVCIQFAYKFWTIRNLTGDFFRQCWPPFGILRFRLDCSVMLLFQW